jgi:hypothetical protein
VDSELADAACHAAAHMSLIPFSLALKPGVSTQATALQTGAGVNMSNLIRHKIGQIQKLGGCVRLSNSEFIGTARSLLPWADLSQRQYIGIGTTELLEVYQDGEIYPIQPIEATSDLATPFTTVAASTTVTITDGVFAPAVGQWINIANITYVDGITLQGLYQVSAIGAGTYEIVVGTPAIAGVVGGGDVLTFDTTNLSSVVEITLGAGTFVEGQALIVGVLTTVGGIDIEGYYPVTVAAGPVYTIEDDEVASSTATAQENGGDVRIEYLLVLPAGDSTTGTYGTGLYSAGPYGIGTAGSPIPVVWWLALWGENLIAAYAQGTLYEWTPPVALGNVATPVAGAPSAMNGVFVAAPQQQAVAWGIYSATLLEQDDLLIGWCDVADLNDWTATAINQAGTFRLSSGSRIQSGLWNGLSGLIWTDLDLWSMTYVGFPLIYGFNRIGENSGLLAPRAVGVLGSLVAWMSQDEFFIYRGGGVQTLPCDVHDFVFDNIDKNYQDAVFCAVNSSMSEFAWWYPTQGSEGVCNAYVKWNSLENLWDVGSGSLLLSAWADQSVVGTPIGADYSNLIQQFETSYDFDGDPLDSWFLTGFFQMSEGEEFVTLKRIMPDFTLSEGGVVQVTVYVSDMLVPSSAYPVRTYGPYTVTAETPYFIVRARGRVMQFKVQCTTLNTFWRYGKPLAEIQKEGRR